MKKIIILMIALLLSECSKVKPAETVSRMQPEWTAETTTLETLAPEETTETTSKETEVIIEPPKEETTMPPIGEHLEQKPTPETSAVTTEETPVEQVTMETTTLETPTEAVEEEKLTRDTGNSRNAA